MYFQRALLPVHFYTFVQCYFALFVYCVSCSELHWHYGIGLSEKEGGIFAVMIHDTEALNGANKSRSCDHNSSSIIPFQVLHALENFNGLHSTLVSLSLLLKLNFPKDHLFVITPTGALWWPKGNTYIFKFHSPKCVGFNLMGWIHGINV